MKNFLIIGGLGFIGSYLTLKLTKNKNYKITIIDNYSSINLLKIKDIKKNKNVKIIKKDYTKLSKKLLKNITNKNTIIIHLAAVARVRKVTTNYTKEIYQKNIIGISNLIKNISDIDYHQLIFASTSSVYTETKNGFNNEYDALGPLNHYGLSKAFGELLIKNKLSKYIILRIFNVYGICKYDNPKKNNLLFNNLYENNFKLEGDGHQSRDFLYIDDLITAINKCIRINPNKETINIGSGIACRVQDFISYYFKTNIKNEKSEIKRNESYLTRANISKAKNILDWKPKSNLINKLNELSKK